MGFSQKEYWSGLPCPAPGNLPDPWIEPISLTSPAWAGRFFTTNSYHLQMIEKRLSEDPSLSFIHRKKFLTWRRSTSALLPMWLVTFVNIQHFVHLPLNITRSSRQVCSVGLQAFRRCFFGQEVAWIGKEFPNTELQKRMRLLRTKGRDNVGAASTAGWPPDSLGRANSFLGLVANFYSFETSWVTGWAFLPNLGLGSWLVWIREAFGNGYNGAPSVLELTLVLGSASVPLGQDFTAGFRFGPPQWYRGVWWYCRSRE